MYVQCPLFAGIAILSASKFGDIAKERT